MRGTREFQNIQHPNSKTSTRRAQIQVNPHNWSEIRRRDRATTHIQHSLCRHHDRRSFEVESTYFSICKHNTSCFSNYSPQLASDMMDGGTSPREMNGDYLETLIRFRRAVIKAFNPSVFGAKMQNSSVTINGRARANLANHGLRRCPWQLYRRS